MQCQLERVAGEEERKLRRKYSSTQSIDLVISWDQRNLQKSQYQRGSSPEEEKLSRIVSTQLKYLIFRQETSYHSNSKMPLSEANTTQVREQLSLELLIKLLPEPFDGNPCKLRSFIKQVDSTFELATPSQQQILIVFVKKRIIGKARDQIDIHCNLTLWSEISELLLNLYQDKKSFDQLMEELTSVKQEKGENVSQFYQRLEDLSSRTLANVYATDTNDDSLSGRTTLINQITLNRFVHHTHPQVSQMLRYRDFSNINSALTAAVAEEKALRLKYDHFSVPRCRICSRTNHTTNECHRNQNRMKAPINRYINFNQNNLNNPTTEVKQCRYCKNLGHVIEECRKRQYNNTRQNSNSPIYRQNHNATPAYQQTSISANNSLNHVANRRLPNRSFVRQNATAFSSPGNATQRTPQPSNFLSAQQSPNPPISMEDATTEFNAMRLS